MPCTNQQVSPVTHPVKRRYLWSLVTGCKEEKILKYWYITITPTVSGGGGERVGPVPVSEHFVRPDLKIFWLQSPLKNNGNPSAPTFPYRTLITYCKGDEKPTSEKNYSLTPVVIFFFFFSVLYPFNMYVYVRKGLMIIGWCEDLEESIHSSIDREKRIRSTQPKDSGR